MTETENQLNSSSQQEIIETEEEDKENFNPEGLQQAQHFEQLELNTSADDMESQLNPDAKEFIPVSPVSRSQEFSSPPPANQNGIDRPLANPLLSAFDDAVVSQSPRKGDLIMEEDVTMPATENEFDIEADARPHEVNLMEVKRSFKKLEFLIKISFFRRTSNASTHHRPKRRCKLMRNSNKVTPPTSISRKRQSSKVKIIKRSRAPLRPTRMASKAKLMIQ